MSIFNATGFAIIDWSKPYPYTKLFIFTTIILVGYIVIWFYWKGRNWARILVLLTSLLCLYNLYHWNRYGLREQIMVGAEAVLAIFLLYWLNTADVRSFLPRPSPNKVVCWEGTRCQEPGGFDGVWGAW